MNIHTNIQIIILLIVIALALFVLWRARAHMIKFVGGAIKFKDLAKQPRTKSEKSVIDIIEKITGKDFPTVYLPWLKWKGKPMELDGYNDELKVGVEFSGPLHTKWYSNKESYEKYYERVKKDREKIRLCKEHGVDLIVIDMSIPSRHMYKYIHSRLWDLGLTAEKPFDYMPAIVAEPYLLKKK